MLKHRTPHPRLFANLRACGVLRQEEGDTDGEEEQPLFSAEWLQEEVSEAPPRWIPCSGPPETVVLAPAPDAPLPDDHPGCVHMCVRARAHECIPQEPRGMAPETFPVTWYVS
jgi:hypothetical protein